MPLYYSKKTIRKNYKMCCQHLYFVFIMVLVEVYTKYYHERNFKKTYTQEDLIMKSLTFGYVLNLRYFTILCNCE